MEVCDRLHGTPTAKRLTVFLRCEMTRLALSVISVLRSSLVAFGAKQT
jgi:hypothetical protein